MKNIIGLLKGMMIASAMIVGFLGLIFGAQVLISLRDTNPILFGGITLFIVIVIFGYAIAHDKKWIK